MDKQIWKLKKLVDKHLNQAKEELSKEWKNPLKDSDDEIWFFRKYKNLLFWNEVAFIFIEDKVVDIIITEYILGIEICNIYFFEHQSLEYKVVKSF